MLFKTKKNAHNFIWSISMTTNIVCVEDYVPNQGEQLLMVRKISFEIGFPCWKKNIMKMILYDKINCCNWSRWLSHKIWPLVSSTMCWMWGMDMNRLLITIRSDRLFRLTNIVEFLKLPVFIKNINPAVLRYKSF